MKCTRAFDGASRVKTDPVRLNLTCPLAAVTSYRAIAFPDAGAPATATRIEVSGLGKPVAGTTNVRSCRLRVKWACRGDGCTVMAACF